MRGTPAISPALLVALGGAVLARPPAAAAESTEVEVERLTARLSALRSARGDSAEAHCQRLVADARGLMRQAPHDAAVLLELVAEQCPGADDRADLLLDLARAHALVGNLGAAAPYFLRAAEHSRSAHELAPAVEGFVATVTLRGAATALPPVSRYVATVGRGGRLDAAGYETLYALGRTLVRRADNRADEILAVIPDDAPAARRALYLRGVLRLRANDAEGARPLFDRAASLPPPPGATAEELARDTEVRELAWLAVGRLAFDAGDAEPGFFAYQQVVVHSPVFSTAFLELGWLAMETGNEEVALLAFEPLIDLDPRGDYGRRAALLRGYVMLHRKDYDLARSHYEAVGAQYRDALARFDREIAAISDLADLARHCVVRDRALADPLLESLMARLEVEAARRLDAGLTRQANQAQAVATQLDAVDALLAGRGPANPLVALARLRQDAAVALQEVNAVAVRAERQAARQSWRAAATPAAEDGCCTEPRLRLRTLRGDLESLLLFFEEEEQKTRTTLEGLRHRFGRATDEERRQYAAAVLQTKEQQRGLARQAIAATRLELQRTAMEGDAGVLEAIWRFKEDHREQIRALELERKNRLGRLDADLDDHLAELDEE